VKKSADVFNRAKAVRFFTEASTIADKVCEEEIEQIKDPEALSFFHNVRVVVHALLAFSYRKYYAKGSLEQIYFLKNDLYANEYYDLEPDFQKSKPKFFHNAQNIGYKDKL